jgi:hypothetical protein
MIRVKHTHVGDRDNTDHGCGDNNCGDPTADLQGSERNSLKEVKAHRAVQEDG